MLRLPTPPDSPALADQILRVVFNSAIKYGTKFEPEAGRKFHNGSAEQYGAVRVAGLDKMLNDGFPKEAEGFYHSGHGLFLELAAALFMPPILADAAKVCLHCRKKENDEWEWRLVRCLPHAQRTNLVRGLLEQAADVFGKRSLGETIQFSDLTAVEAFELVEWSDLSRNAFAPADTKPGLDLTLRGACVSLGLTDVPLRLNLSRLITQRESSRGWLVTLREEAGGQQGPETLDYTASLDAEASRVTELHGPDGKAWNVSVNPVQPAWRVEPPVEEPASDETTSPATEPPLEESPSDEAASREAAPPRPASTEHGIWVCDGDEWLHWPVSEWAATPAEGESRRWPLSVALPSWGELLRVELWLDNCGAKELRFRFDWAGELSGIELGLQTLFLSATAHPGAHKPGKQEPAELERFVLPAIAHTGFVPGSWQPAPDRPPCPDASQPWTLPGALSVLSVDGGGYTLRLDHDSAVLRIEHSETTHWVRTLGGLVGPAEWASNDPGAAAGISSLRGLVPLIRETSGIKFHGRTWVSAVSGKPRFPDFARDARLLTLRPDEPRPATELSVIDGHQAEVRQRHANPHLDAQYARIAPNLASPELTEVSLALTWVRDRYDGETHRKLLASQLETETFVATDAPIPPDSARQEVFEFSEAESACFAVIWRRWPARWDVRLSQRLRDILAGSDLLVCPLRLRFQGGQPMAVDFHLTSSEHPPDTVLSGRVLTADLDSSPDPKLQGGMALSAEWLAKHHRDQSEGIEWLGRAQDPAIAFLGVDSSFVRIEARRLLLGKLRYWVRLDGLEIALESPDTLALDEGRWCLLNSDALLRLTPRPNDNVLGELTHTHHIAPNLQVTEVLLGEAAGTLRVNYAGNTLAFAVRTSYHTPAGPGADAHRRVAFLRAGSYHLAWAGQAGNGATDFNGGFKFAKLTRLFLHLARDEAGRLAASGMIGWQCRTVPEGLTSATGRATLYAPTRGEWSRLRLSGKWTGTSQSVKSLRSLVFFRHDFALTTSQGGEVSVKESLTPWLIAAHAAPRGGNLVHCYHGCSWTDGRLKLSGEVLLLPKWPGGEQAGAARPVQFVRPAVRLRLLTPTQARWRVDADASLTTGPLRLEPWALDGVLPSCAPPPPGSPVGLAQPTASAGFGLTRLDHGAHLICPVQATEETHFDDELPKLWIIHDEGEDLVPLEGFLEKVGPRTENPSPDPALLRRCAEETLTFLRWRKPAVLEYWLPVAEEASERVPVWQLVDAPLLNVFSELDFLTSRPKSPTAPLQPDLGLITYKVSSDATDERVELPRPWPCELSLKGSAGVDNRGHPWIAAQLDTQTPLADGVLQLRRETPLELASSSPAWNCDRAPWLLPESVFQNKSGEPLPGTVLLPPTAWRFACPRPGELTRLWMEVTGSGEGETLLSPLVRMEIRSPRAKVEELITLDSAAAPGDLLRWRLNEESRSAIADECQLRVLAGLPNRRQLPAGTEWVLAVAGQPDSLPAGTKVAVNFKSGQPFEVRVGEVSRRSEPVATQHALWLLVGAGAFGQACSVVVTPQMQAVEVSVGVARKDAEAPAVTQWEFVTTGPESVDTPDGVAIPNSSFSIVPGQQVRNLLPPMPHLIGLLSAGRVVGYGPCVLDVDVEFTPDRMDCFWVFKGAWQPPAAGWLSRVDALVSMRPDGSANAWRKSP